MSVDLAQPIITVLEASSAVTDALPAWGSIKPIHSRRPIPADTTYPCIAISPTIGALDTLAQISNETPEIIIDISVFDDNDTATNYRAVESLARTIRDLFHRNRRSITISGYSVTQITCTGPIPGPLDDDVKVHRVVTLTVQLVRG
jgi:hypothetical protein